MSTGIETDAQSLRAVWPNKVKVDCPHCGGAHEMAMRETYLEAPFGTR